MIKKVFVVLWIVSVFLWYRVVEGAVIQVSTTQDGGAGSLRAAITEANSNSEADTINVPAGVYRLSGVAREELNASGDLDCYSPHKITIVGAGAASTIIDGSRLDRVFHILSGTVYISGLTIQNGVAPNGINENEYGHSGGGVYNLGKLTLISCVIKNNLSGSGYVGNFHWRDVSCPGGGGSGGGIYNNGSLSISECTILYNRGGNSGGAIDTCGSIPVGGHGGGICNGPEGTLVVDKTTISDNISGKGAMGGSDHDVENKGGDGGGIANFGVLTLKNSTLRSNSTGEGGFGTYPGGDDGNSGNGGGLYNGGEAVITQCIFRENFTRINVEINGVVEGAGGGIYTCNKMTLDGCSIIGNFTGSGGAGGGIANKQGTLTLQNSTIYNNHTGGGCGSQGQSGGNGGGIYNSGLRMILQNCTISGNQTGKGGEGWYHAGGKGGDGGGVYCDHGSNTVNVTHCTIVRNTTGAGGDGNDAHMQEDGLPGDGGGLYQLDGTYYLENSIIADNSVFGNGRGADLFGTFISNGYNIIENSTDCFVEGVQTGVQTHIDPKLMALADNGGPTLTHALMQGSPAIDAGYAFGCTKDQRGLPRTIDMPSVNNVRDGTDIGAYEASLTPVQPSHITVDKSLLIFGCDLFGHKTGTQCVSITNTGNGTLYWSATSNVPWLFCSPASGTGNAVISISISNAEISPGTYNGTITIKDPDAENSPQYIQVQLNFNSSSAVDVPIGVMDTPVNNALVSGSIPVTGWAVDRIGMQSIKIYRSPNNGEGQLLIYIGEAIRVEGARPDVASLYATYPESNKAGWGYMLLTHFLPDGGNGSFLIHAIGTDIEGNQVTLGQATIVCDNAHAVKPFGAIDTPTQGGIASGYAYVNFGWALTPLPNTIPFNGSSIVVWVDGISLGHPVYNQSREDIINLFPGYHNTNGAVGYYYINTVHYRNGVHTIAWSVEDDAGNSEGIGSRYFSIQNNTSYQNQAEPYHQGTSSVGKQVLDYRPLRVKVGYEQKEPAKTIYPNLAGQTDIYIQPLERLEIHFFDNNDGHIALDKCPIGASVDAQRGIFYWQPGVGFRGQFPLTFTLFSPEGVKQIKEIRVFIGSQKLNQEEKTRHNEF